MNKTSDGGQISNFTKCKIKIQKISELQQKSIQNDGNDTPNYNYQFILDDIEINITKGLIDDNKEENKEQQKQLNSCSLIIIKNSINLYIPFPFKEGQRLVSTSRPQIQESDSTSAQEHTSQNPLSGLEITLTDLIFTGSQATYTYTNLSTSDSFLLTFELQTEAPLPAAPSEKHFRFDFSGHNLPLSPKKFSFFKSTPLLSFCELVEFSTSRALWESDLSKFTTCDPVWTLTSPIPESVLRPKFIVNIYQSIDQEKSKRAMIGTVEIEMERVVGEEKETMFELQGSSTAILMIDRVQEV